MEMSAPATTATTVRIKMPKYDYKCNTCNSVQEIHREFGEDYEPTCCQMGMSRVWSATPAIFRGGGWGGS